MHLPFLSIFPSKSRQFIEFGPRYQRITYWLALIVHDCRATTVSAFYRLAQPPPNRGAVDLYKDGKWNPLKENGDFESGEVFNFPEEDTGTDILRYSMGVIW